jgi:hypothetical protein
MKDKEREEGRGRVKWTDLPFPNREDWNLIKTRLRAQTMRETRAWVQGYILALEDMINDLEEQRTKYLNDRDAELLIDLTRLKVQESLASARLTLSTLNEVMEEGDGS